MSARRERDQRAAAGSQRSQRARVTHKLLRLLSCPLLDFEPDEVRAWAVENTYLDINAAFRRLALRDYFTRRRGRSASASEYMVRKRRVVLKHASERLAELVLLDRSSEERLDE